MIGLVRNRYFTLLAVMGTLCAGASAATAESGNPSSGLRVYVDPATGQLAPAPAQETPDAQVPRGFKRATTAAPRIEAGTTPSGGVLIQLENRFVSDATVTIGPDGKPVGDCILPQSREADLP